MPAKYLLGIWYVRGAKVEKNVARGLAILEEAARGGHALAKMAIARTEFDEASNLLTKTVSLLKLVASAGEAAVIAVFSPRSERLRT